MKRVSFAAPEWWCALVGSFLLSVCASQPLFAGAGIECTGACCLSDAALSCITGVTEAECTNAGGEYWGDGVECYPELCGRFNGACCLPDGNCVEIFNDIECNNIGGTYLGYAVSCDATICLGACCFTDGTCHSDQSSVECANLGGDFQGPNTVCPIAICRQQELALRGITEDEFFTLEFLKFDTRSGTRLLTKVSIEFNGAVIASLVSPPAQNVRIVEVSMSVLAFDFSPPIFPVLFNSSDLAPQDPNYVPPLLCDVSKFDICEWCDYGSSDALAPLIWSGSNSFDSDTFSTNLNNFSLPVSDPGWSNQSCAGNRCASVDVVALGEFSADANDALLQRRINAAYELNVIYEFESLGACCVCNGSCIGITTEDDCRNRPDFGAWREGLTCAESPTCICLDDCKLIDLASSDGAGGIISVPDGVVDLNDVIYISQRWGCPVPAGNCEGADIAMSDGAGGSFPGPDGHVDLFDISLITANWGPCD